MSATSAIVVAAGTGSRMGASVHKAFLPLAGRPLFLHSVELLAAVDEIEQVVVVVHADDLQLAERAIAELSPEGAPVCAVRGGAERWHSVRLGLDACVAARDAVVLVHDAARPLVSRGLVERVVEAARTHGAAIPAVPVVDTILRVDSEGFGVETVSREGLARVQTPQGFRRELLESAFDAWDPSAGHPTDESQVVRRAGGRVRVVAGEERNVKVTTPEDLDMVESWLRHRRK